MLKKMVRLRSVAAMLLTFALSMMFASSSFAQTATRVGWLGPTAFCNSDYYQTGADRFGSTDWFAVLPGRIGVVTAGWIGNTQTPGPVKLTLQPGLSYNLELVSGAVCVGEAQAVNAWVRNTCPQCVEGASAPATASAPAAAVVEVAPAPMPVAAPAPAQTLPDLRWSYSTGEGQVHVAPGFFVNMGELGLAYGGSINGTQVPVFKLFGPGEQDPMLLASGELIVGTNTVVQARANELNSDPRFRNLTSLENLTPDRQTLAHQEPSFQAAWLQGYKDWHTAAGEWAKAHTADLAKPKPAQDQQAQTASNLDWSRVKNTGPDKELHFDAGVPVFGAHVLYKGGVVEATKCFVEKTLDAGIVTSGVIGRMPFEDEIKQQGLKPCVFKRAEG